MSITIGKTELIIVKVPSAKINTANNNSSGLPILGIILVLAILAGCSALVSKSFGMKSPRDLSEPELLKWSAKFDIPTELVYRMDTAYYTYWRSIDSAKYKKEINDHLQPLQAIYYNKRGRPIAFFANCYAGGFPNLNWNHSGNFNHFPPASAAPIDSLLNLQKHLQYLKPADASRPIYSDSADYHVVVHWNRFMGRQTERFVQVIKSNCAMSTSSKVRLYYVNTDRFFASENFQ